MSSTCTAPLCWRGLGSLSTSTLILMMRFRPEGIVPNRRRQRELHDVHGTQADAMTAPPGSPVAQGSQP